MDIRVSFPGGKRVDAAFDGHVVHTDQPRALGGDDSAPAPFALFLSSLATCAGIYVLGFCQARGLSTDDVMLVQTDHSKDGKLLGIDLEIRVPSDFPGKYLLPLQRAAEGCKVKKTLDHPPTLRVSVTLMARPAVEAP